MDRLRFQDQIPIVDSPPARTDVACFVGLIGVRGNEPGTALADWLTRRGWARGGDAAAQLLNVPVLIDSWVQFDRLFAWDERTLGGGITAATYLGTAIRTFFAQGGRRCYIVRAGDPLPANASAIDTERVLRDLIPLRDPADPFDTADRRTWRGIHHLTGLPDVSFLSLPDLPELFAAPPGPAPPRPVPAPPAPPEQFVECSQPAVAAPADSGLRTLPAPRSSHAAATGWRDAIAQIAGLLAERHREVMLIASLPLAHERRRAASELTAYLAAVGWLTPDGPDAEGDVFESRFVQLTFPWLETAHAQRLAGVLEPPEATLVGLLARNALTRGTYRSATAVRPDGIRALFPDLTMAAVSGDPLRGRPEVSVGALADRVSVWSRSAQGVELQSDVTTSRSVHHRPASIQRIIALVTRTARTVGEQNVFENSGDALWATLERQIREVLDALYQAGALDGKSAADAYSVRCDRSTMSQNDIDNGRVIVAIGIRPTASIEFINVALTLRDGGTVSLGRTPDALAATGT